MSLLTLGWSSFFEEQFNKLGNKGFDIGRITSQAKGSYTIRTAEERSLSAILSGKFRYKTSKKSDLPAVGDWVCVRYTNNNKLALIHNVLKRKSAFSRKMAISGGRKVRNGIIQGGTTEEQVIVANIDVAFIVCSLDINFDLRRLERYLTLTYNSGATPVILLNKVDLCDHPDTFIAQVSSIAPGVQVFTTSIYIEEGITSVIEYLNPGNTIVFLGSSGVGKSSIINRLFGEELQRTGLISESTGKGKHTTTAVNLLSHSSGCMIVDTPGTRELQLWADEKAVDENFKDIVELAHECRYADCKHEKEPDCAVKQAIVQGIISKERMESYRKQYTEVKLLDIRKKQLYTHLNRKMKRGKL